MFAVTNSATAKMAEEIIFVLIMHFFKLIIIFGGLTIFKVIDCVKVNLW